MPATDIEAVLFKCVDPICSAEFKEKLAMQFNSVKWLGLVALSTAILFVSVHHALRAEDDNNSAATAGRSSVLKIAGQSSDEQGQKPSEPLSSTDIESEKSTAESETTSADSRAVAKDQAPPPAEDGDLKPMPNPDDAGPVALEAASFKGVTPGAATIDEVEKLWGAPKEIFKQNDLMTQLYSIKPFDRVEVSYQKHKVSSIVIRFDKPFPADKIAQQLDMASVKPVLVSNELAEILGQAYPERGVLLAFEPSPEKNKPSMKVTHIILEPLGAEPFILRAETEIENRYDLSQRDLEQALNLQPNNARANWLLGRVLSATDQLEKAEAASAKSVQLEPENPRYRVTRAQILGQLGRSADAIKEAQQAVDISSDRAHIQARALCLLGDLTASGPKPDYRKAISYHTKAVQVADAVANDPHPAIRLTAKEVLVDAHLGAVHDIAWGDWKEKDVAVNKWLEQAASFADDLVQNEGGSEENQFRVYTRALTACVGLRGKIDPKPWIQEALTHGNSLIDSTSDPLRKAQYQWDLGMALYDAVQIYQLRADHATALKYAQAAVQYLEKGYERKQSLSADYVLGRLYFRLGAIHAIRDKNHEEAVVWFDKAAPLLMKPLPPESVADLGREGETFVSMGVSYWETNERAKALELTGHGISLMEEAVKQGTMEQSSLIVPYNNISSMHRNLGSNRKADQYQEMAAKIKDTKVK
jgi:tetratricopeptide (TPR) repeat protein